MAEIRFTLERNGSQTVILDPKGWQELQLVHNRDTFYKGMFYEFTLEVGFYCNGGGKEIVDAEYEFAGSEGEVYLYLDVNCNGAWTRVFSGSVDFGSYRQEYKGNVLYTFVNIVKTGITQVIRNREDLEVNLLSDESLDGTTLNSYTYAPYNLTLHSKVIHIETEWEMVDHNCCYRFVTNGLKELYAVPEMSLQIGDVDKSIDQESACGFSAVFNGWDSAGTAVINTDNSKVIITPQDFTVNWDIHGVMSFNFYDVSTPPADPCDANTCGTNTPNGTKLMDTINYRLRLLWGGDKNDSLSASDSCGAYDETGTIRYIDLVTGSAPAFAGNPTQEVYDGSGAQVIRVLPGDKFWVQWIIDVNFLSSDGDLTIGFEYTDKYLQLESDTTYVESVTNAIAIHEAWSRLSEIISDQTLAFKSEFFGRTNSQGLAYTANGCGAFTALSSGRNIRLLEYVQQPILASVKKMFESCNAIWGIGLGVEMHGSTEVIRVEGLDYWFSDTVIFTALYIPNMQMEYAGEWAYNEIEIGYRKWETESTNGLDEPMAKATWTFPAIKQVKNKFSALCEFVASMYAIELTRRQIPEQTKDFRYDKDTFIFALAGSPCVSDRDDPTNCNNPIILDVCEKDENFTSVTNLLDPASAYNLRFNLASNFDRLMNQFTTGITKQTPQDIKNTSFEGNGAMKFQFTNDNCIGELAATEYTNVQDTQYVPYSASPHRRPDPIVLPEKYTFSYPVSFEDYITIKNNPQGVVEFSGTDGQVKKGYILTLTYHLKSKLADFVLIRKFE